MTTIADRLLAIPGQTSGTVVALVAAFPGSSGSTIDARFVSYSGLATGTVAEHLNVSPQPIDGGASGTVMVSARNEIEEQNQVIIAFISAFVSTSHQEMANA